MSARPAPIPSTRVISPSPTPTESSQPSYFAPITRSAAKTRTSSIPEEDADSDSSLDARARARSRSPETLKRRLAKRKDSAASNTSGGGGKSDTTKRRKGGNAIEPLTPAAQNGHLAPPSSSGGYGFWRSFSPSRSPSPLGLIPIHRSFRTFVHKHEIPRKLLHVSIGFLTLHLYTRGTVASSIHPVLLGLFVPIAGMDVLRHNVPAVNRFYVKALGVMMRESEVGGYNGVIWYLLGAWTVLRFAPKDVGTVSVLLLSWCDTAASTVGRLYGRYTPRIKKGKSLAGSLAALGTGVLTAGVFWGWVSWRWEYREGFMFTGRLGLPAVVKGALGWSKDDGNVGGWLALGIVSVWSGVVAAASEVVDLFGWDDNATIPILSGLGLWGFFKVFAT